METVTGAYDQLVNCLPGKVLHIILVNDGSQTGIQPDHISALKRAIPLFTYCELPENKGKGYAIREGVRHSQAPVCLFTDIDFPYTLESILSLVQVLTKDEIDVAIGVKGPGYYKHLPPMRVRISKFLRWLARNFLRISITDTQCGLKGFNTQGKSVFLETTINRYLCDLEFIFLVDRRKDLVMQPIPVVLKEGVVFSHVNTRILLREGMNFFKVFFRSLFTGR